MRRNYRVMNKRKLNVWTIGHSTRTLEEFLGLLAGNEIKFLADVRGFPGSRKYPHFNPDVLRASLAQTEIECA